MSTVAIDLTAVPSPAPSGAPAPDTARRAILDPGLDLTLRPMRYPDLYDRYRAAIRNTWTVEEIDFSDDLVDLQRRLARSEQHLIRRLVAFFATGDSIVANNLVLNLYLNAPEARLFLSRQLYEEALHVQFYLTLPVRGRSTTHPPRRSPPLRLPQPVRVHGAPGCPGAVQLLRTHCLRLPGRRHRRRQLRRRLLTSGLVTVCKWHPTGTGPAIRMVSR